MHPDQRRPRPAPGRKAQHAGADHQPRDGGRQPAAEQAPPEVTRPDGRGIDDPMDPEGPRGDAITDEGLEAGADPADTGIKATIRRFIRKRRKAIAAAIASAVGFAALHLGLDLDAETSAGLAAAITGLIVERISNALS